MTYFVLLPPPTGRRGVPSASDEVWWLPLLVAAEATFTLAMIALGPLAAEEAITVAAKASALAVAATYLRPAVLSVGTLLRLRDPGKQAPSRPLLPHLTILLCLELATVAAGVLWARLDTSAALRLAVLITVVCTAVCLGPRALRTVARQMLPPDASGR